MTTHYLDRMSRDLAVEQSLDAAIELDEAIEGTRANSPALATLVGTLTGHAQNGANFLSNNSQMASLYHRAAVFSGKDYATTTDLGDIVGLLTTVHADNLAAYDAAQLSFIRDFCLGLNKELVSEAYRRTPEPPMARVGQKDLAR